MADFPIFNFFSRAPLELLNHLQLMNEQFHVNFPALSYWYYIHIFYFSGVY